MPIYVYEVIQADGSAGPQFEYAQGIKEPPLTQHPETGEPVQRVIQPPFIGGSWSEGAMHKASKDDKKLDQLGFTKYVKAGDGYYEKRAGTGPDVISRDRPIAPGELNV
jgi:predicted nucleic acid-binding Zn ribbon protein